MKQLATLLIIAAFYLPATAQESNVTVIDTTKVKQEKLPDNEAEKLPWRARRFRLMAGSFFPSSNTEISVSGNNGNIGTKIDFEDDLGFKTNTTSFYANAMWRASKRSRFELEYFTLNRNSTYTLEKEITFDDHVYPLSARVDAYFDVTIARFSYGYAILCKPKYEVGLLVGAHLLFLDVGISLDTANISADASDKYKVTAPLPDFGIWSEIVITKRLGLYVNANYLSAKVDTVEGSILSYNVSLLYNVYKNFSLTAGYTGLDIDVDIVKERANAQLQWGYNGPSIAATYTFGNYIKFHK